MKIEISIKEGNSETKVIIDGDYLMVNAIVQAIKEAVHKTSQYAEIR